jgi:hypothetical protein
MAARFKIWTAFDRTNTGIVGWNPTRGMDVCVRLFCVCVVLCVGSGLATGWSPLQEVLPIVYMIKKLKKRPRSEGLYSQRKKEFNYQLRNGRRERWNIVTILRTRILDSWIWREPWTHSVVLLFSCRDAGFLILKPLRAWVVMKCGKWKKE